MGRGQARPDEVIRFRPEAAREFTHDVGYYNQHYPGRGDRFASKERTRASAPERVNASETGEKRILCCDRGAERRSA